MAPMVSLGNSPTSKCHLPCKPCLLVWDPPKPLMIAISSGPAAAQRISGPADQRTSGSADQRISGSADQRISGPADQRISGSADQRTSGPADQRISGSADQRISGPADQRISGSADQRISGSKQSSRTYFSTCLYLQRQSCSVTFACQEKVSPASTFCTRRMPSALTRPPPLLRVLWCQWWFCSLISDTCTTYSSK